MQEAQEKTSIVDRFVAFAILTAAVTVGLFCSGLTIYVLLVMSLIFSASLLVVTLVPTAFNVAFLVTVIQLAGNSRLRKYAYKPLVWLSILISLPILCWLNYEYVQIWKGF
jgi:hypothetical protein